MIRKEYLVLSASVVLLSSFISLTAYLTDEDGPLLQPLKIQYGTNMNITICNEQDENNPAYYLEEQILTPEKSVVLTPVIRNDGDYKVFVFMELSTSDDNLLSIVNGNESDTEEDDTDESKTLISSGWCKLSIYGKNSYAYGDENQLKALKSGADITSHIYTQIILKPDVVISEDNEKQTIVAYAYAIQADGLKSTNPAEVWKLIETGPDSGS